MLEVRMVRQRNACLHAVKAAEIIQDDEKVARWIVGPDGFEQLDVMRGGIAGEIRELAETHTLQEN